MRFVFSFFFLGCSATSKTSYQEIETQSLLDEDGDGYLQDEDCDDFDPQVFPEAVEICDAIDNNCNGLVDEGVTTTFYQDLDVDGFGNPDSTEEGCQPSEGFVQIGSDCDDSQNTVYPGANELCDGLDNDCDDLIDNGIGNTWYRDEDGDGFGGAPEESCAQGEGYVDVAGDCDDANATVYPNAEEICDGIDNDCDGLLDEGVGYTFYTDVDGDGFGNAQEQIQSCEMLEGMVENGSDCDDLDTNINPEAQEFCDYVDNNCDGIQDEATALDALIFYLDSDGDGYGHTTQTQASCYLEVGLSDNNLDCDDTNNQIYPTQNEICDGLDNNCDEIIDDSSSLDAQNWYADSDSDGFGDALSSVLGCAAPLGTVANSADCDDVNSAIHPNAQEICDTLDNDCDGFVDSTDPSVTGEPTWYIDIDGDGYGGMGFNQVTCTAPSGYVDNDQDCNNTNGHVHPGADEFCNSVDDDCDGTIDEADALDALPWYVDSDADGYGAPQTEEYACFEPIGYTDNDEDCDDAIAQINPDSSEIYDLIDNDCDGTIDEDLWLGSGLDGDLNVTTPVDLSTHIQPSRSYPEAVSYRVSTMSSQSVTLTQDALGIEEGDEILLINIQGSSVAHNNVGTYEFLRVSQVSGATISFVTTIVETYGNFSNIDLGSQVVRIQRVPQYADVTVSSTLTTSSFDGVLGGLLCFRASGIVDIGSSGRITVDGLGYRGGSTGSSGNCDAYQGESYAGLGSGQGNGSCSAYNEATGQWAPNFGGGGAHITGGGGNYGGGATGGASWTGGSATAPQAGLSYGISDLSLLFFGSGGGGVWNGSGNPGSGGNGGGIIYIGALTINAVLPASISAKGNSTPHWAQGSWTYGAGGGAGGSVYLEALNKSLVSGAVSISGGLGYTAVIRPGGHGGVGRSVY